MFDTYVFHPRNVLPAFGVLYPLVPYLLQNRTHRLTLEAGHRVDGRDAKTYVVLQVR